MQSRLLKRALVIFVTGFILLLLGLAAAWYLREPSPAPQDRIESNSSGEARIGGPFELTDQNGEMRRARQFAGEYMLIYFGFTFCPDVCPTALTNMTQALDMLDEEAPAKAEQVVPIFITVDPERDTVEEMASYAQHFHPDLVALTGTKDQIAAAAKKYRVYYEKVEDASESDYLVDHSSYIYLMGPEGEYLTHFTHQTPADELASGLERHIK
ncbi:MAG: SCO family protein [Pseudomonadota bacterium]|uniref:SCO family protein n=1 Tax=Fodinicurvata fenggangensis TaxID=1121830 RepID=UPI00047E42E5|nr:SCO family protein [Fodinicurvata fenggangensis]